MLFGFRNDYDDDDDEDELAVDARQLYHEPDEEQDVPKSEQTPWWHLRIVRSVRWFRLIEENERLDSMNIDLARKLSVSGNSSYIADARGYANKYHNLTRELAESKARNTELAMKCEFYEKFFTKIFGGEELSKVMANTYRDLDGKLRSTTGRTKEETEDLALQKTEAGIGASAICEELGISESSLKVYVSNARKRRSRKQEEENAYNNKRFEFNGVVEWWYTRTFTRRQVLEMLKNGACEMWDQAVAYTAEKDEDQSYTCGDEDLLCSLRQQAG